MSIRIRTNGDIDAMAATAMNAAHAEFAHTSTVMCNAPFVHGHTLFIDDFGAQDEPFNRKAWALYGRGPIFGTAFIDDDHDSGLLSILSQPFENWPLDQQFIDLIVGYEPVRPDMLVERPES